MTYISDWFISKWHFFFSKQGKGRGTERIIRKTKREKGEQVKLEKN